MLWIVEGVEKWSCGKEVVMWKGSDCLEMKRLCGEEVGCKGGKEEVCIKSGEEMGLKLKNAHLYSRCVSCTVFTWFSLSGIQVEVNCLNAFSLGQYTAHILILS